MAYKLWTFDVKKNSIKYSYLQINVLFMSMKCFCFVFYLYYKYMHDMIMINARNIVNRLKTKVQVKVLIYHLDMIKNVHYSKHF